MTAERAFALCLAICKRYGLDRDYSGSQAIQAIRQAATQHAHNSSKVNNGHGAAAR